MFLLPGKFPLIDNAPFIIVVGLKCEREDFILIFFGNVELIKALIYM